MLLQRGKFIFLLTAVIAVGFLATVYPGIMFLKPIVELSNVPFQNKKSQCELEFPTMFAQLTSSYRQCLVTYLNAIKANVWDRSNQAIDFCLNKTVKQSFDVRQLDTKDEDFKFVMLPAPNDSSPCVEVTLGVGNDIAPEEKLKKLQPQCKFFGADPILASGKVFENIGRYFEIAVGAESGFLKASVYENGAYNFKNVTTMNLEEFLKKQVGVDRIDYFWVDNEGAEYEMLRKYFIEGHLDVVACQMPIELHGPLEKYNMNGEKFSQFVIDLIAKSHFLPLWSYLSKGHVRAFYINMVDQYCVDKFILPKMCKV